MSAKGLKIKVQNMEGIGGWFGFICILQYSDYEMSI